MGAQPLRVVKDRFGWQVCFGQGTNTCFRTRELAVREARLLCEALRLHGLSVDVIVEDEEPETLATEPRWRPAERLVSR